MTAHADYHEVMLSNKISQVHIIFGYAALPNTVMKLRLIFAITEKLIRNAVIVMEM